MEGKKVKKFRRNQIILNISGIPTGTYFIKLTTEEGILTKKVIIE